MPSEGVTSPSLGLPFFLAAFWGLVCLVPFEAAEDLEEEVGGFSWVAKREKVVFQASLALGQYGRV